MKGRDDLPVVRLRGSAALPIKKGRPDERPFQFLQNARSSRFWLDGGRGGFFGPGRDFFAFDVAVPAFSIFNFVILSAHNSLLCSRVAVLWCAI